MPLTTHQVAADTHILFCVDRNPSHAVMEFPWTLKEESLSVSLASRMLKNVISICSPGKKENNLDLMECCDTYDTFRLWAKCLLCLIPGQADSGMDTKSLQLSKQDESMQKKKKNRLSLQMKVPVRKCEEWVYQSVTAGCRLEAWVTVLLCFLSFSWILPGKEQGREKAGVASSICFLLILLHLPSIQGIHCTVHVLY